MDIQQGNDGCMRELALFAGAGGGILGGMLLGWRTVCAVEIDRYAASVLVARQNDGLLPHFPIWDDIRTFDGRPWRGIVDVISGGFPCQDISAAGRKAGVQRGEKSGLWREMARVIGEIRPRYAFVENSPLLVSRGLDIVIADLSTLGYDARWGIVSAQEAGAPHKRERIWIVAQEDMADARYECRRIGQGSDCWKKKKGERTPEANPACNGSSKSRRSDWWVSEPNMGRMANGMAARVDRLKAIGNGQVPAVATIAWRTLNDFTV